MKVGELCIRTVLIARGDDTVLEAANRMRDAHVGSLVVVAEVNGERRPIGIVTDRDLLFAIAGTPERAEDLRLAQIMRPDLVTARESDDVSDALDQMRARGVRRLPVVDDRGTLQGILAYDDLVEWVAEELGALTHVVRKEQVRERRS